MNLIVVPEDFTDAVHLHNAPGLSGGSAFTLCGWCDVPHDDAPDDALLTCGECLAIIRYCRSGAVGKEATRAGRA